MHVYLACPIFTALAYTYSLRSSMVSHTKKFWERNNSYTELKPFPFLGIFCQINLLVDFSLYCIFFLRLVLQFMKWSMLWGCGTNRTEGTGILISRFLEITLEMVDLTMSITNSWTPETPILMTSPRSSNIAFR